MWYIDSMDICEKKDIKIFLFIHASIQRSHEELVINIDESNISRTLEELSKVLSFLKKQV